MALVACPGCRVSISDQAPGCPHCGWSRAAAYAGGMPLPPQAPSTQHAEGQKLVSLSTKLLAVAVLLMLGGCGSGIGLKAPALIGVGMGVGFLVMIGAAVVGQVGRAKQGRVI